MDWRRDHPRSLVPPVLSGEGFVDRLARAAVEAGAMTQAAVHAHHAHHLKTERNHERTTP